MHSLEERLMKLFNQDDALGKLQHEFEQTIQSGLEESGWDKADVALAVAFLMKKIMPPLLAVKSGV